MPATKTRQSVPLDDTDVQRMNRIDADEVLRAVAARRAGQATLGSSRASLLHVLVVAGLDALEREADEERYAQLADSQDDEDRQYHQALRTHRRAA